MGIPKYELNKKLQQPASNVVKFTPQELTDAEKMQAQANINDTAANATTGKLGYKVLQPELSFASQVTEANTIYEIRDVFDLGNNNIVLPSGSVLLSNGGVLENGNIVGDGTFLDLHNAIGEDVTFSGTFTNSNIYSEIYKTDIQDFSTVINGLLAIVKDDGLVSVRRNLNADKDMAPVSISKNVCLDFGGNTIFCEEREQTATETKHLLLLQQSQPKNIAIKNLNVSAVANITQEGDYSGITSFWGLCHISNTTSCLIDNVCCVNMGLCIKFGKQTVSTDLLENIVVRNCLLHGKILIEVFSCKNVLISNCSFDGENSTSGYDHALYVTNTTNFISDNIEVKNYLDAINIFNSNAGVEHDDEKNISLNNTLVHGCKRFIAILKSCNVNIRNTFFENNQQGQIIWLSNCHNVNINGIYASDETMIITSSSGGIGVDNCTGVIDISSLYLDVANFNVSVTSCNGNVTIKNVYIKLVGMGNADRLLIQSSTNARLGVYDSTIEFSPNQGEPIYVANGCKALFSNCTFKQTNTSQKLLVRTTNGMIAVFENCDFSDYIVVNSENWNYTYPTIRNCTRNGVLIEDYPFRCSGTTTFRTNSLTSVAPIGYLYYDKTLGKLIMKGASDWVNLDGTALS